MEQQNKGRSAEQPLPAFTRLFCFNGKQFEVVSILNV
jgi:hypothetical protein